jgi:glycosyltransferase involved in cell wall biosynthesis
MKVAMVSTLRVNCGIAKYLEELAYPLSKLCDLKIFAEVIHQQLVENEPIDPETSLNHTRCWKRGEPYDYLAVERDDAPTPACSLISEINKFRPDIINIQFQNAMYSEDLRSNSSSFIKMVKLLEKYTAPVVITLHDVIAFDPSNGLNWYSALGDTPFIVTNKMEQEELKKWAPSSKSYVIPLGATLFEPKEKWVSQRKMGLPEWNNILETHKSADLNRRNFYIIQPGFYGADKGMLYLINQMPEINRKIPEANLVFAGSIHPLAPEGHRAYVKECLKRALVIRAQGGKVTFIPKFFSDDELNTVLSAADVLVLNHDQSLYVGSSAIAKRTLYAGKPLIFSDLDPRLSEFEDRKHCLKIGLTRNFSEAVWEIYNSPSLREKLISGAREYANETSFKKIAEKHMVMYNGGDMYNGKS